MAKARIGIDLGTTNTVVGFVYDDGPAVVPRDAGRIMPSVVEYLASGDIEVGEPADRAEPEGAVVRSVKRLMGRTWEKAVEEGSDRYFAFESDRPAAVHVRQRDGHDLTLEISPPDGAGPLAVFPHEVSARILHEARRHAEAAIGTAVEAVVTVPAYFGEAHRAATLKAARAAGLEVSGDLLDEPTAAALAFAPTVGFATGEPILVVDWGGGTLDVTVLSSDGERWLQRAIDGMLTLGGDEVDHALALLALQGAGLPAELMLDQSNRWRLLRTARDAKEALSSKDATSFVCPGLVDPNSGRRLPLNRSLTRAQLEEAIEPLLDTVREVVERCLSRPDADRAAIRKVLMVGGSSRIPAFRRIVAGLLPRARLYHDVDPMKAVAIGAGIYANGRPEIARICPYGYVVQGDEGETTVLLPPNSDAPTPDGLHCALPTRTRYEGQTVYRLKLSEVTELSPGQRTEVARRSVFARGMPATPAGTAVDVEIWLDANKELQAACHVAGHPTPLPMTGRAAEGDGVFSDLTSASLDAEALADANRGGNGGLLERVRREVEEARAATESRDREGAQAVLRRLRDLEEQVEAKQRNAGWDALPDEERGRRAVEDWASFYETEVLPRFEGVLPRDAVEEAIEGLRGLRLQMRTGAPVGALWRSLETVKAGMRATPAGPAVHAFHWASVRGVPGRLSTRLRAAAEAVRRCLAVGDGAGLAAACRDAEAVIAEAEAAWKPWRETGTIVGAVPDLVVRPGEPAGRVH